MQDLRKIFRYARPYRRDLFAAVGLIFIECIFEMVIPVLMSTLVDDGVPAHNMAVIFRQGGLMILCAVLALITGLLYARYAARFANGFAAELRMAALSTCPTTQKPCWTPCTAAAPPAMPSGLPRASPVC